MLYLVHFDEPFRHARHYLGFTDERLENALELRVQRHRSGRGSRLLAHVTAAGISWRVARVWETGDRSHERRLKQHSSTRICPICVGPLAMRRGIIRPTQDDENVKQRDD